MKTEEARKKTRTKEGFNSVEFFRGVKEKLAERMINMKISEPLIFTD